MTDIPDAPEYPYAARSSLFKIDVVVVAVGPSNYNLVSSSTSNGRLSA
jgi:hypothetical protein